MIPEKRLGEIKKRALFGFVRDLLWVILAVFGVCCVNALIELLVR